MLGWVLHIAALNSQVTATACDCRGLPPFCDQNKHGIKSLHIGLIPLCQLGASCVCLCLQQRVMGSAHRSCGFSTTTCFFMQTSIWWYKPYRLCIRTSCICAQHGRRLPGLSSGEGEQLPFFPTRSQSMPRWNEPVSHQFGTTETCFLYKSRTLIPNMVSDCTTLQWFMWLTMFCSTASCWPRCCFKTKYDPLSHWFGTNEYDVLHKWNTGIPNL